MTFRDTIPSDHEWSEDEEDGGGFENEFLDQSDNDEEISINNLSHKTPETYKPVYRVRNSLAQISIKLFSRSIIKTISLN